MDTSKSSTSVMFCISGDGKLLPAYVVYKSKYVYPKWVEGGPPGTRYNRSMSGWFDSDLFEDWFEKIALPYLRRQDGTKVIIGDNLGSHLSYKVIKQCNENNISFVFLPKNSTHLCQPLDVAVFRTFKMHWKNILTEWKLHNKGVLPKTEFPNLLRKMLEKANPTLSANIISGFKACGIIPLNQEEVLKKIKPRYDEINENNNLVACFENVIAEVTRLEKRDVPKRKKRFDVPAGKSVCTEDLEMHSAEELNQINEENMDITQTQSDSDMEEDISFADDSSTRNIKTKVRNICDIEERCFIIASFIYNLGTKKEHKKHFVAKVLKIGKKCIKINCMRHYGLKDNVFIFPDIEDISAVNLKDIDYRLHEPVVNRGKHTFPGHVL